MKRNTCRFLAALLALTLLLTLLPAVAFAEEATDDTAPQLTASFSSNPNKRTALPLTLAEGDQLSINGVAIETVLGPKGNPLISAGALATAAVLSKGQMQALSEEQIQALTMGQIQALTAEQLQALTEGTPHIRISSDGRYISYLAQGAGGTALAGEKNEGLPEKEYALLLAIRKSLNNPNYSWWNVLSEVFISCEYKRFFDYLAEKWGIPAEEIRELMGTRDDDSLQIWLLDRYYPDEDSSRVNINDLFDPRQQKKSDPALAGAVGEPAELGLSDADTALLDAVRKGMNNPNYSWQDLLDYVKQVIDNEGSAYNMMAEHWGIPAETIKELMGDDNTAAFLENWISKREHATGVIGEDLGNIDIASKYFNSLKEAQGRFNINSQAFTLGVNGQTFTLGVNGVAVATLAPTVWQDDLTPPPYHDPSYDKAGEASATDVTPVDGTRDLPPDGVIPDS